MVLALAVAALVLVLATLNGNRDGQTSPLTVGGAWARPALAGGNTAVYMKLTNNGRQPLTITSASSDVAAAVELHETTMTPDFVMQMRPVQGVEVPPRQSVEFSPGGLHVMLLGLNRALNEGDQFTLELVVEGLDEPVRVTVPVQLLGEDAGHEDHAHDDHSAHDDHGSPADDHSVHSDHEAPADDHGAHSDHGAAAVDAHAAQEDHAAHDDPVAHDGAAHTDHAGH